jgi:ribosome-associated protein
MERVKIVGDYITLSQLLKLSGIAATGGQAKFFVLDGRVKVNGQIANQRGKKIYPGDLVEVNGSKKITVTK